MYKCLQWSCYSGHIRRILPCCLSRIVITHKEECSWSTRVVISCHTLHECILYSPRIWHYIVHPIAPYSVIGGERRKRNHCENCRSHSFFERGLHLRCFLFEKNWYKNRIKSWLIRDDSRIALRILANEIRKSISTLLIHKIFTRKFYKIIYGISLNL